MTIKDLKLRVYKAQKDQDTKLVSVLRFLLSAIQNKEIELRAENIELTEEHIIKVIKKQIKQLKKAIELYQKGNRQDLVQKEQGEVEILEGLLDEFENKETS